MYYHIKIKTKTNDNNTSLYPGEKFMYDYSELEEIKNIIRGYYSGTIFQFGQYFIEPKEVREIEIRQTNEKYKEIIGETLRHPSIDWMSMGAEMVIRDYYKNESEKEKVIDITLNILDEVKKEIPKLKRDSHLNNTRKCKYYGDYGYFHGWTMIDENSELYKTYGIIENIDGDVHIIEPQNITFLDVK